MAAFFFVARDWQTAVIAVVRVGNPAVINAMMIESAISFLFQSFHSYPEKSCVCANSIRRSPTFDCRCGRVHVEVISHTARASIKRSACSRLTECSVCPALRVGAYPKTALCWVSSSPPRVPACRHVCIAKPKSSRGWRRAIVCRSHSVCIGTYTKKNPWQYPHVVRNNTGCFRSRASGEKACGNIVIPSPTAT